MSSENKPRVCGRKDNTVNMSKWERVTDVMLKCGSLSIQIEMLKQNLKLPALSNMYEIMKSRCGV